MHVVKELCLKKTASEETLKPTMTCPQGQGSDAMLEGRNADEGGNGDGRTEGPSRGYMPLNFSFRSQHWSVAVGKNAFVHCGESATKSDGGELLANDGEKQGSRDSGTAETRQPAFRMMSEFRLQKESNDAADHSCNTLLDDMRILEKHCNVDSIHQNDASPESHPISEPNTDDLYKEHRNTSVNMKLFEGQNVEKRRPLVRQSSVSTLQLSDMNELNDCEKTSEFHVSSRYLRHQHSCSRRGNRSVSDLGFIKNVPKWDVSNSRTFALLQNPIFRKQLAQTMRLDPNSKDFDTVVFEKLSKNLNESFDRSAPGRSQLSSVSNQSLRLCSSTSDLGLLKDLHKRAQESQPAPVSCHAYDVLQSRGHNSSPSKISPDPSSSDALSNTSKLLSSFRLPSYSEFKASRQKRGFISKSMSSLHNLVPTILEEDSCHSSEISGNETETTNEFNQGDVPSTALKDDSVDEGFPSLYDTNCSRPKETLPRTQTVHLKKCVSAKVVSVCDVGRDTECSQCDIWEEYNEGKRCQSTCGAVIYARGADVKYLETANESEHNVKEKFIADNVNSVPSDYASESDDECSDSLEDVFLKPTNHDKSKSVEVSSGEKDAAGDGLRDLSLVRVFSDSGCLVDRKSFESDLPADGDINLNGAAMPRSTSDVSEMFTNTSRTKCHRQLRNKQNKSDPFNAMEQTGTGQRFHEMKLQKQDSREDILKFLEMNTSQSTSGTSCLTSSYRNSTETRRNSSHKNKCITSKPPTGRKKVGNCEDCGTLLCSFQGDSQSFDLCMACKEKRHQRKEAVLEIVETEQNYGNDLSILNKHFYEGMKNMGLLSEDQMKTIFINLAELITVNRYFLTQLNHALDTATEMKDELLWSVNIGQLFLDASNMLLAYETYCINQSAALVSLDLLLAEKHLLRIFLDVTQREKSVLRKMDLKSFLMVPVQRVMKYPLLLKRLQKVTPSTHADSDNIIQARKKIENMLELINSKTNGSSMARLYRRTSSLSKISDSGLYDNIEVCKVAMETLGWDRSNLRLVHTGYLRCAVIADYMSLKRARNLKYAHVQGILVSLGKNLSDTSNVDISRYSEVQNAALVLVKEKGNRQQLFREPLLLSRCVVCMNDEDAFELHDAYKDSLMFKCDQVDGMREWFEQIRALVFKLCCWRRRRNAMANLMLCDL